MKKIGIVLSILVSSLTIIAIGAHFFPDFYDLKKSHHPSQGMTHSKVEEPTTSSSASTQAEHENMPSEIIPRKSLVGGKYPFCGESDVIPAYFDKEGTTESFLIPSCYQIKLGLSSTNLVIYTVLEESDGWLRIKKIDEDQPFSEEYVRLSKGSNRWGYEPYIVETKAVEAPPAGASQEEIDKYNSQIDELNSGSRWIKKDQAFTAWTLRDGEKMHLIESLNPEISDRGDGTWSVYSLGFCFGRESTNLEGNNRSTSGLQMNVNYDPNRDCGT